jgi:hypothetical protein
MILDADLPEAVGPYRLLRAIGRGSYSRVFAAVDVRTGAERALKIFVAPTAGDGFVREAAVGLTLRHPNLLAAHDMGYLDPSRRYVAYDLAAGGNLRERLRMAPLLGSDTRFVRHVLVQVARALDVLHREAIVHRDVKPENVLLADRTELPRVVLADLGAAARVRAGDAEGDLGSPAYMAPEQIRGACDVRADVYALGVVAYELLAGQRPFLGSPREVMDAHLEREPDASLLPAAARGAVLRALAKRPEDRWPSAYEMVRALDAALASEPSEREPPDADELARDDASGWVLRAAPAGRGRVLGIGAPQDLVPLRAGARAAIDASSVCRLAVRDDLGLSLGTDAGGVRVVAPLYGLPPLVAIRRFQGDVVTVEGPAARLLRVRDESGNALRKVTLPVPLASIAVDASPTGEHVVGLDLQRRAVLWIDVQSERVAGAVALPRPARAIRTRGGHVEAEFDQEWRAVSPASSVELGTERRSG